MTPLRQRMLEDMQLRGLSARTQECYVAAVRQLAAHIAIANSRLDAIDNGHVTFRYRDNRTQAVRRITLPGVEFLQRFLQHVLPRGCAKVRYDGLWSAAHRNALNHAVSVDAASLRAASPTMASLPAPSASPPSPPRCSHCHQGHLIIIDVLRPQRKVPP